MTMFYIRLRHARSAILFAIYRHRYLLLYKLKIFQFPRREFRRSYLPLVSMLCMLLIRINILSSTSALCAILYSAIVIFRKSMYNHPPFYSLLKLSLRAMILNLFALLLEVLHFMFVPQSKQKELFTLEPPQITQTHTYIHPRLCGNSKHKKTCV